MRWRRTTPCIIAALAALRCSEPPAKQPLTPAIVPVDAETVMLMDAAALTRLEPVSSALSKLEGGEFATQLEQARACGYELHKLRSLMFAEGDSFQGDRAAVAIEGEGFGRVANLECAATALGETVTWEELDGRRVGHLGADSFTTYIVVDDDQVVVVGERWARPVAALLEGQGRSTLDAAFTRAAEERVPRAGAIAWYAGELPAGFAIMTMFDRGLLDDVERLAVAARPAEGGLALEIGLEYGAEASAERFATTFQQKYHELRKSKRAFIAAARLAGVNPRTLASLKVRRDGRWILMNATLDEKDVARAIKKAERSPLLRLKTRS